MTFPVPEAIPGVKLRAGGLRRQLATFGFTATEQSFQADLYSDVAGLSLPVERNAAYAFLGYVGYRATATPDIKFTMAAPEGSRGHWSMYPQTQTATGSVGDLEALRLDAFDDAEQQGAAGSASFSSVLFCAPRGFLLTQERGGALTVRFAQVNTSASQVSVAAGSWLRLIELDRLSLL